MSQFLSSFTRRFVEIRTFLSFPVPRNHLKQHPGNRDWSYWLAGAVILGIAVLPALAGALPEFAYRDLTVEFTQADGKPVPKASVYGFCRELNLVWPRRDHEVGGRNDVLWHESFLGKTDEHGTVKMTLPPGKWGFFAAGRADADSGTVVAGWSDFKEPPSGGAIHLKPTAEKKWVLSAADSEVLAPKRIFLKPEGFPAWIPITMSVPAGPLQIQIPAGHLQIWATGGATEDHPGFALDCGVVDKSVSDGKIIAPGKAYVLECKGGKGSASLTWVRRDTYGLEGEIGLCADAKVRVSPGLFTLAYRRPLAAGLSGKFVGQLYNLAEGGSGLLNLEAPVTAGLDQRLAKGKKGKSKLNAQLYLVDGNGHLLDQLFNSVNEPVNLSGTVTFGGQQWPFRPVLTKVEALEEGGEDDPESDLEETGNMWFAATVTGTPSDVGAVWEFPALAGLLRPARLTKSDQTLVRTRTFKAEVPRVLERPARNLLGQMEMLAANMNTVAGKRRIIEDTAIRFDPGRKGASSGHNGAAMSSGTLLLFRDNPTWGHTIVHELGHSFGFHHGGLHETIIEASRSVGGVQISAQPVKWNFMDRMNGVTPKPARLLKYPNIGLYLYGYAQGGSSFVHFMSAHEYAVISQLEKQGFTNDELTTALLTVALGRDLTAICANYGLAVSADRMAQALPAVRGLCQNP